MITLAITHYNRYDMILEAMEHVLDDPRVDEIVIADDASTDGSWEKLLTWFYTADADKVKLYRNEVNLDCYANKAQAVSYATNPWVILFDSDNILPTSYIDALMEDPPFDPHVAHLPVFAEPEFDYRAFAGLQVDRHNVAEYMDAPMFSTALNTANYVVARDEYLRVHDRDTNPGTVDSLYTNYRWLLAGNALRFVPGMTYSHRMHDGSHYVLNHTRADETLYRHLLAQLRGLR